jgi:hypothetical protein
MAMRRSRGCRPHAPRSCLAAAPNLQTLARAVAPAAWGRTLALKGWPACDKAPSRLLLPPCGPVPAQGSGI